MRDTDTWRSYPDVLHMVRSFSDWKQEVKGWSRPPSKHQQRDWLLTKLLESETPRIDAIPLDDLKKYAPAWRELVHELQSGEDPYLTKDRMMRDHAQVQELFYGEAYRDSPEPKVYIAPVASGNAVRADKPFADVQIPVRGTLAIDMEGAAFYRTAGEFSRIRLLLVKGVSDYADPDKDDSYHTYAAEVSAAYMFAFIQEFVTSERMPHPYNAEVQQGNQEPEAATSSASSTAYLPAQAKPLSPQEEESESDAIRVFFSYALQDETLARELKKHLVLLKRQGLITSWHSYRMIGGQEPEQQVQQQLQRAQIILLLVSPDFLFSDEHYTQMTYAVEARKACTVAVIPILLRSTDKLERTPIGKLLMLPRNNKPIQQWHDRDAAFAEVAREIRAVVAIMLK